MLKPHPNLLNYKLRRLLKARIDTIFFSKYPRENFNSPDYYRKRNPAEPSWDFEADETSSRRIGNSPQPGPAKGTARFLKGKETLDFPLCYLCLISSRPSQRNPKESTLPTIKRGHSDPPEMNYFMVVN